MDKLYMEIGDRRVPISDEIAQKYKLKKGTYSPYTGYRIVDENGGFPVPENKTKDQYELQEANKARESIAQENMDLSTSEIIDFSQGVDSDNK